MTYSYNYIPDASYYHLTNDHICTSHILIVYVSIVIVDDVFVFLYLNVMVL